MAIMIDFLSLHPSHSLTVMDDRMTKTEIAFLDSIPKWLNFNWLCFVNFENRKFLLATI